MLNSDRKRTNTKAVAKAVQEHILDCFDSYDDMLREMQHYEENYGPNFGKKMVDDGCFLVGYSQIRDLFQDILNQTPKEQERFSNEQVWNFYENIIAREVRHVIAEDSQSYIKPRDAGIESVREAARGERTKAILSRLESYAGHGLDAHALDRFEGKDKTILSNALENEDVFAEAFDAAAETLGIEAMPEAWDDPNFEAEFLDWALKFGKESHSVMYWSMEDENEDYVRKEDAKQRSAWEAAGLDDDSISEDGSEFDDPNYHGRSYRTRRDELFESTLREYEDGSSTPVEGLFETTLRESSILGMLRRYAIDPETAIYMDESFEEDVIDLANRVGPIDFVKKMDQNLTSSGAEKIYMVLKNRK